MKWQLDQNNPAGKIQVNRFNKAWSSLCHETYTTIEKIGVIGRTTGIEAESSYATTRYVIGSNDSPKRDDVEKVKQEIGEKYAWSLSAANAAEVTAAIVAALPALIEARPVNDKRETEEAYAARLVIQKQEREERDKAQKDATAKYLETCVAAYGSGEIVTLAEGEIAIVATLCYDNSHYQSDYFDMHARLSCPFIIGKTRAKRETEAEARYAVSKIPQLAGVDFVWRTEKHAGGHGNYLQSGRFEVPAAVGALRTCYGSSGPVKEGHWEIAYMSGQWSDYHDNKKAFDAFAGYVPSAMPAAAASSGDGRVRYNQAQNGVEIKFDSKPAADVLAELKGNGFRWSFRSGVWYKRFSETAWKTACQIAGVEVPVPSSSPSEPDRFDMQVEDNMAAACGL